jgi:2-keto-3-deoxy-L-rhamnonate aldolase RhmA
VAAGAAATGVIVFSGSPLVVEVIAAAGVDFVILDMEHSPLGVGEAAHLIRAADASGIPAFVRVPDVDRALITRLLDLRAAGIVLPHATAASCRALVSAMRYAPEGERGACQITRAAGYRRGDWEAYAARASRELMAVALIEDTATLQDIDAVAAVPGIDTYFVGPTDLSVALGVPGSTFDDPELGAALDRVTAAAKLNGKSVMTLLGRPLDVDYGKRLVRRGVHMVVLGTDADLLTHSLSGLSGLGG